MNLCEYVGLDRFAHSLTVLAKLHL